QLGRFATVRLRDGGGMRGLHTPSTSNASFWIGPRWWVRKECPQPAVGVLDLEDAKVRPTPGRTRRRRAGTRGRHMGASRARGDSAKDIFGAGDEDAGAAGLAPDALVARSRRTVIVVAGHELAFVDPQLAVEEMQLFDAGMRMRRVAGAGREAHQHADPV